jgi:hypothetical protein
MDKKNRPAKEPKNPPESPLISAREKMLKAMAEAEGSTVGSRPIMPRVPVMPDRNNLMMGIGDNAIRTEEMWLFQNARDTPAAVAMFSYGTIYSLLSGVTMRAVATDDTVEMLSLLNCVSEWARTHLPPAVLGEFQELQRAGLESAQAWKEAKELATAELAKEKGKAKPGEPRKGPETLPYTPPFTNHSPPAPPG